MIKKFTATKTKEIDLDSLPFEEALDLVLTGKVKYECPCKHCRDAATMTRKHPA
jgi:hypothetical protein